MVAGIAVVARGCCRRSWSLPSPVVAVIVHGRCCRPWSLLSHDVAVIARGCWHGVLLLRSFVIAGIVRCCCDGPLCQRRLLSVASSAIAGIVRCRWRRLLCCCDRAWLMASLVVDDTAHFCRDHVLAPRIVAVIVCCCWHRAWLLALCDHRTLLLASRVIASCVVGVVRDRIMCYRRYHARLLA